MFHAVNESKGWVAGASSTMLVAGAGAFGWLDELPKSYVVAIAGAALLAVSYFAKRDWNALNDKVKANDAAIIEKAKAQDLRFAAIERRLQDFIDQPSFSVGQNKQWDEINALRDRQSYMAGALGISFDGKKTDVG